MQAADTAKEKVAFIGTGVMGSRMARNLLGASYELAVHSRTRAKAADVEAKGAEWSDDIAGAVRGSRFVVTIVGFPDDVRDVYLGPGGIVASASPGSILIDMTTSQPSLAREIYERAAAAGMSALDAPVSGGDVGARDGTLSIMVGGDPDTFETALPLLQVVGKTIVLQGPAGSGQHAKMCNQIAIASNMIGVMEALLYGRRAGLDPNELLASIGAGAAGSWSMSNLYPRVVQGDFGPGFYVEHFLKDLRIALSEAERMGLELPGLALARRLYERVIDLGGARQGTQALYRALEDLQEEGEKEGSGAN